MKRKEINFVHLFIYGLVLLMALMGGACSKSDDSKDDAPPIEHKKRFEGWTTIPVVDDTQPHITFLTSQNRGEEIEICFEAEWADADGMWVDLNNNGKFDNEDQKVTNALGLYRAFKVDSPVITIYGKQIIFKAMEASKLVALDVTKAPDLKEIKMEKVQLTYLDISKNELLKELGIEHSSLEALYAANNIRLSRLVIYDAQLKRIDLRQMKNLMYLRLSKNQLTHLDVSKNRALNYLTVQDNQLTSLDLRQNKFSYYVLADNNQLTNIEISPELQQFDTFSIVMNNMGEEAMKKVMSNLRVVNEGEKDKPSFTIHCRVGDKNFVSDEIIRQGQSKGWNIRYTKEGEDRAHKFTYPKK